MITMLVFLGFFVIVALPPFWFATEALRRLGSLYLKDKADDTSVGLPTVIKVAAVHAVLMLLFVFWLGGQRSADPNNWGLKVFVDYLYYPFIALASSSWILLAIYFFNSDRPTTPHDKTEPPAG